jgi:hypothetical protein
MDQMLLFIGQNRAFTLMLMSAVSLCTAAVMSKWLRQGLRERKTWMVGGGFWLQPSRDQRPILFWTSISSQVVLIGSFVVFGIAMLVWSFFAR